MILIIDIRSISFAVVFTLPKAINLTTRHCVSFFKRLFSLLGSTLGKVSLNSLCFAIFEHNLGYCVAVLDFSTKVDLVS